VRHRVPGVREDATARLMADIPAGMKTIFSALETQAHTGDRRCSVRDLSDYRHAPGGPYPPPGAPAAVAGGTCPTSLASDGFFDEGNRSVSRLADKSAARLV